MTPARTVLAKAAIEDHLRPGLERIHCHTQRAVRLLAAFSEGALTPELARLERRAFADFVARHKDRGVIVRDGVAAAAAGLAKLEEDAVLDVAAAVRDDPLGRLAGILDGAVVRGRVTNPFNNGARRGRIMTFTLETPHDGLRTRLGGDLHTLSGGDARLVVTDTRGMPGGAGTALDLSVTDGKLTWDMPQEGDVLDLAEEDLESEAPGMAAARVFKRLEGQQLPWSHRPPQFRGPAPVTTVPAMPGRIRWPSWRACDEPRPATRRHTVRPRL